jgi:hypothetical protein
MKPTGHRKKICKIVVLLITLFVAAVPLKAATEQQIEASIDAGVEWLVAQQDAVGGSWGGGNYPVGTTGFALIKLQDRAYELGKDPFETDAGNPAYYEYAANVIKGWEYLFSVDMGGIPLYAHKETIGLQDHTGGASGTNDDPDTNGNGYGIVFGQRTIYETGICLLALVASGKPNRVNDGAIDYDGDANPDTFGQIAQDVADWLAFAQSDSGIYEGGYGYGAEDNQGSFADNSNSGYAYLGLAAAEATTARAGATPFACTVPAWVKTELNVWITTIQDPVDGDANDGCSWYIPEDPRGPWANELKTGNLVFEMTFYGDDPSVQRFQDARDYIERHWQGLNVAPGWRGDIGIDDDSDGLTDEDPFDYVDNDGDGLIDEDRGRNAHYQAMYCLMKGLAYSGVHLIDTDGDGEHDDDWFNQEPPASPAQDLASVLLAQQNLDGSWPSSPAYVWPDGTYGTMSSPVLSTIWALLTLEKITPPPAVIPVSVDIKPGSCPNPFNLKSRGVLPVAILGTDTFDVAAIDAASIHLEGVPAIRSNYEDVTRPVMDGFPCECTTAGPDGFMDLTLKFNRPPIALKLWLDHGPLVKDQVLVLELTGNLLDGTPISGSDCVVIRGNIPDALIASQADINKDGIVDFADLGLIKKHFWKSTILAD